VWQHIPDDTDIVVVHTPPKGILDLAYNRDHTLEFCGCSALKKRVLNLPYLKLVCFGHIHNNDDIINAGTMKLSTQDTIFSNGSVVTDRKFGKLSSNGNIIEL
jgi:Icc-related predicted phosphoesterase